MKIPFHNFTSPLCLRSSEIQHLLLTLTRGGSAVPLPRYSLLLSPPLTWTSAWLSKLRVHREFVWDCANSFSCDQVHMPATAKTPRTPWISDKSTNRSVQWWNACKRCCYLPLEEAHFAHFHTVCLFETFIPRCHESWCCVLCAVHCLSCFAWPFRAIHKTDFVCVLPRYGMGSALLNSLCPISILIHRLIHLVIWCRNEDCRWLSSHDLIVNAVHKC